MALKQIKNKIKSIGRTSKVTKAMEAVSAVKMRKAQERALDGRLYAEAALRVLTRVASAQYIKRHAFFAGNKCSRLCVLVITSDKGLASNVNSAVLKATEQVIAGLPKEAVEIICFGKKSYEYFLRRGYHIPQHFLNVRDDISLVEMEGVVSSVQKLYTNEEYGRVVVVYQNFISTFEQEAVARQLLPIDTTVLTEMVARIAPKVGKYSNVVVDTHAVNYVIEPNNETVYNTIVPMLMKVVVYHALLESKASEHSARMVAMKNATDKATEVSHLLTLQYNKERQSVITAEVSEITGGIEAMKTV